MLTVTAHFDEDINDAVPFYTVRPEKLVGTLVSHGTKIFGNSADEDLESATLRAVHYVLERYRAVTTNDYEILISAALMDKLEDMDYRIVCLNNRNFEWGGIGNERPGQITTILIVNYGNKYLEKSKRLTIIRDQLQSIAVFLQPFLTPIIAGLQIADLTDAITEAIEDLVETKMQDDFGKAVGLSSAQVMAQGIRNAIKTADLNTPDETIANIAAQADQAADASVRKAIVEMVLEFAKNELIEWVKAFMDKKRILTTRIHAVFPQFRKISLEATLLSLKGADIKKIRQEAARKLVEFIDPIKGGPDREGWPLGRNLYRSEIYQILEGVKDVDHVIEVKIDQSDTKRVVMLEEYELINLDYLLTIKEA